MNTLALLPTLGWPEMLILLVLGLLIFGRRLPEVGRSLGKGIVEFRRGLNGIEEEIRAESSRPASDRTLADRESPVRAPLTEAGEDARVSQSAARTPAAEPHAAP